MTDRAQFSEQNKQTPEAVDIAIVGNPNAGKTTVFNALTGLRQKVGNYPGVTVEKKTGRIHGGGREVRVHDLPGLYSLIPKSLDDKIASDIVHGHSNALGNLRLVVVVVDASNLSRNLYLVTQVIELGLPVLVAANMMDAAAQCGIELNTSKLADRLGCPVISLVANKRTGIPELKDRILSMAFRPNGNTGGSAMKIGTDVSDVIEPIAGWLRDNAGMHGTASQSEAVRIVSSDVALEKWLTTTNGQMKREQSRLSTLVAASRDGLQQQKLDWTTLETNLRYKWVDEICRDVIQKTGKERPRFSEIIDKVLTHRVAGPLCFLILFALIFQSIFSWAEVPMAAIDSLVTWAGDQVATVMPDGVLEDLLVNGAITGVGAILVFLPQILFLFFFLSLLEDTGYMARVAFIMDRLMRGTGLSGRSVIPLLSSFACAIPGIMATRTISASRDRLVTIMIAPLMSCSARLPVYALIIGAFVPATAVLGIFTLPGLVLLALYLLGIFGAVVAAFVFTRFLGRKQRPSTFVMELPPYRMPSLRWILLQMFERARIFVMTAGKIILAISIVLWFLSSYPRADHLNSSQAIKQSYAGQLGQVIEPVIRPLGFDWKMGIGLITSFAAREVLVSTMATIYNVENADENSQTLREILRNEVDPETGQPVYTPLVAVSLMVFFVFACQCMSTVAIVRRETNSWRWPVIMVAYMTAMAYLGSLIVYQGGIALGLG